MLINGQPSTTISIADRGLAYGDGVFETLRFQHGRLLFGNRHLQRLVLGCERLGLQLDMDALRAELSSVLQAAPAAGIIKLIVTRAEGGRGYRPGSSASNRILTLHPLPNYLPQQPDNGICAFVCRLRMSLQPALAGIKHLNRLEQVLASSEWPDANAMEGLLLDYEGHIVEGTRSNVFFVRSGSLYTPALQRCGVDGILRQVLLTEFAAEARTGDYTLADLDTADELFFCNSVFGVWPVVALQAGDKKFAWQVGPFARRAQALFAAELLI